MIKRFVLSLFIALCTLLCSCTGTNTTNTGLQLWFLDTGKSDCILIQIDDINIICDTADEDDFSLIQAQMQQLGIEKLDYMILTHFDKDHIGSAAQLVRSTYIENIFVPDYNKYSSSYTEFIDAVEDTQTNMTVLDFDKTISTEHGTISITVPHSNYYEDENNYSLITAIEYGDTSVLLMGDALKERTTEFLDTALAEKQYDIIKAPHHGDYNKSLAKLFESAAAQYCIITCDASKTTLEKKLSRTLNNYNVTALFTYEGNIHFSSDGTDLVLCEP